MKNIFIAVIMTAISIISAKSQDSTNSPITRKLGLVVLPLEEKIGLTYCFGKKGRIKIEDDIKFLHLGATKKHTNSHLGYYTKINELKFMFAWKSSRIIKMYSGVSLDYGYYNRPHSVYGFWNSIIPIGIELFPSTRFPGLNLVLESNYGISPEYNPEHTHSFTVRVGVGCYF